MSKDSAAEGKDVIIYEEDQIISTSAGSVCVDFYGYASTQPATWTVVKYTVPPKPGKVFFEGFPESRRKKLAWTSTQRTFENI